MQLAWIPNLLTLGNLACGFVSVIFSSLDSADGYITAAALILLAAFLDGADGTVARRLGVGSRIGTELDSLADCVAFGVAPGYLAYRTYLMGTGRSLLGFDAGILIAAVFPLCAAYRLARFNVGATSPGQNPEEVPAESPRCGSPHPGPAFSGLPSPVAGIVVALAALCFPPGSIPGPLFAALFLLVGFLMISTIGYSKPQSFVLKNLRGLKLAGLILLVVLLLFLFRFWIILLFIAVYIVSGLVGYIIQFIEEHRY